MKKRVAELFGAYGVPETCGHEASGAGPAEVPVGEGVRMAAVASEPMSRPAWRATGRRWTRSIPQLRTPGYGTRFAAAVYVATRVAVLFGGLTAYLTQRTKTAGELASRWDSWWYLDIAQHGYSTTLHPATGDAAYSQWAFFPVLPMMIRVTHEVTRLGYVASGYLLISITGFLAVRAVYALGEVVGGRDVARASAAVFAAWPGSVALSMVYSEGLFVALAAASLAWLVQRRWWAAGLAGAAATGTRALGLGLVAAAVVAAVQAWRVDGDRRGVIAPALASGGIAGFLLYARLRTGHWLEWLRAERLWHQTLDFGRRLPGRWYVELTKHSLHRGPQALLELGGTLVLLAMLVLLLRQWRTFPPALTAYAVVVAVLIVGSSAVGTRPRIMLAFVPGFIVLGRRLHWHRADLLAIAFASTLSLVAFLYVGAPDIVP